MTTKTPLMAELEEKFQTPIQKLIPILVSRHSTDMAAIRYMAAKLDRPLDPSIIAVWSRRLEITNQVKEARKARRDRARKV